MKQGLRVYEATNFCPLKWALKWPGFQRLCPNPNAQPSQMAVHSTRYGGRRCQAGGPSHQANGNQTGKLSVWAKWERRFCPLPREHGIPCDERNGQGEPQRRAAGFRYDKYMNSGPPSFAWGVLPSVVHCNIMFEKILPWAMGGVHNHAWEVASPARAQGDDRHVQHRNQTWSGTWCWASVLLVLLSIVL